jgi:hypothetical protein
MAKFGTSIKGVIGLTTTAGFLAVLWVMLTRNESLPDNRVLDTLVGGLSTAWAMVIGYYFGSSASSDRKTELLARSSNDEPRA